MDIEKICPECGRKYMIDDLYCSECGTKLVDEEEESGRWTLVGGYNNKFKGQSKKKYRRSMFGSFPKE